MARTIKIPRVGTRVFLKSRAGCGLIVKVKEIGGFAGHRQFKIDIQFSTRNGYEYEYMLVTPEWFAMAAAQTS